MSRNDPTADRSIRDALLVIDELCDRFEDEWKAGRRPDPSVFAAQGGVDRAALVVFGHERIGPTDSRGDAEMSVGQPHWCGPSPQGRVGNGTLNPRPEGRLLNTTPALGFDIFLPIGLLGIGFCVFQLARGR